LQFESDDLPAGASLNSTSGDFSWTPGESDIGTYSFTIRVSDGKDTAQISATVTVNSPPPPPPEENPQEPN